MFVATEIWFLFVIFIAWDSEALIKIVHFIRITNLPAIRRIINVYNNMICGKYALVGHFVKRMFDYIFKACEYTQKMKVSCWCCEDIIQYQKGIAHELPILVEPV